MDPARPAALAPATPFSATLEEVTHSPDSGPRRMLCRVYRTARGRARSDFLVVGAREEPANMAWLFDAATRLMVLVDRQSGAVLQRHAFERPRSGFMGWNGAGPFTPFPFPQQGTPRREDLGTRVVEGFVARGSLTVYLDGWHECWTTPDLPEASLLERWRTADGHERTTQLFAVRLGEPDPSLFAALDVH
jgi:hypothetical protein